MNLQKNNSAYTNKSMDIFVGSFVKEIISCDCCFFSLFLGIFIDEALKRISFNFYHTFIIILTVTKNFFS